MHNNTEKKKKNKKLMLLHKNSEYLILMYETSTCQQVYF